MKRIPILSLLGAALLLAGCQRRPGESPAEAETVALGPKYSAKQGLFVPNDTRLSLGLKTVEVMERKITATLELAIRVYRTNASMSFASGTVSSDQAHQLVPGQAVQVLTSDGAHLPARIAGLSDQLQKASGLAEVLIEIPNPSEPLVVGAFSQARVVLESSQSVVTIPRAALLECSDGPSVYTVSGDHLVRAPVKLGVINDDFVEITDGLYAGDQVVLQPVLSLWMTELAAVKGGQACCAMPKK